MMEQKQGQWAFTWADPFWQQPLWRYDAMMNTAVRSAFICSQLAAPLMIDQRNGLIVNLSTWAAQRHLSNVPYGISKAATDKLTADTAYELKDHGVTVVSLYPGLVRTESVMQAAAHFDLSNSESPDYQGRAVSYLYQDDSRLAKSGKVVTSAQLGLEYGFTDLDGKQIVPLNLNEI